IMFRSIQSPTCSSLSTRLFFFFSSRRRHTISKRDRSSDVCSSYLHRRLGASEVGPRGRQLSFGARLRLRRGVDGADDRTEARPEIGRASCRERVELSVLEESSLDGIS